MKSKFLLIALLSFSTGMFAQNSCAEALPVATGIHTMPQFTGTEIPVSACYNNADMYSWYMFTPVEDMLAVVTTDLSQNLSVDTRVSIYSGVCGATTCIASDDDSGSGFLSIVSWNATADVPYFIVFDNYWNSDAFDFQITTEQPIVNAVNFTQIAIPTSGSTLAVVDMNADFLDDVVAVSGSNLNLNYQQLDGSFVSVTHNTGPVQYGPGWSLAAGDLDNNGYTDLVYAGSGASFIWANADGTGYSETSENIYIFCQRSNMVDLNADGKLDVFVCHDVEPNVQFTNQGDQVMVYNQGGMGMTPDGGNYGSVFIDYDNDCDMDMFIAKCRGGASLAKYNQLHRNNGDGTFTEVSEESNLWDPTQTWSSCWADFDNDGWMDVMVTASSFSDGGHKLMRNNGDGTFTNVTTGSGIDLQTGSSIENVQADFNNDGWVDVLGLGNKLMINNGDMTFSASNIIANYGPIGDLNNDGFIDVMTGSTAYLNTGNENNWIVVNTVGTVSNKSGIGARVTLYSAMGQQIRDVRSGQGFRYMQTLNTHFGIGTDTEIAYITICWPSGIIDVVNNPDINTKLTVVEGSTLQVLESTKPTLSIYPNPAEDFIQIQMSDARSTNNVLVYDLSGKIVLSTKAQSGRLDISTLPSGFYTVRVDVDGKTYQEKLVIR